MLSLSCKGGVPRRAVGHNYRVQEAERPEDVHGLPPAPWWQFYLWWNLQTETELFTLCHRQVMEMVGTALRKLRLDKGITMSALARSVGVSRQAIWLIENGKRLPRVKTVADICDALGVERGTREGRGDRGRL